MRAFLLLLGVGAFASATALAQPAAPPSTGANGGFRGAQYDQRPDGGDFAHAYPSGAIDHGVDGIALMCCTARPDRKLDCRVGVEWPRDAGFGGAGLRVSRKFRLSEESYAAYQAQGASWTAVPLIFTIDSVPRGFDEIRSRVSAGAAEVCGPGHSTAPE